MPNFFYTDANGQKHGTFTPQQLKELVAQEMITPQTPLETDTGKKGLAGQIKGLFPAAPSPFTQSVPPKVPAPVAVDTPDENGNGYDYRRIASLHRLSTWSILVFILVSQIMRFLRDGSIFGEVTAGLMALAVLSFSIVCVVMLARSIQYNIVVTVIFAMCMFPGSLLGVIHSLVGVLIMLVPFFGVYYRAAKILKQAGYKIGFIGANMRQFDDYISPSVVSPPIESTQVDSESTQAKGGKAIASLVCGIGSLITLGGFLIAPIIGLILGIFGLKSRKSGIAIAGICVNAVALLLIPLFIPMQIALLLPAIQAARGGAQKQICVSNMRQIGFALDIYESINEAFPPLYTVDNAGRPLHSWRVLILPYIEQTALYEQIRLDEPWDSPYNSQFHSRIINEYRCPSNKDVSDTNNCVYAAIKGEVFVPADSGKRTFGDVKNGISNTIAFIEVKEPFCWMDPTADITLNELTKGINVLGGRVGSFHSGGCNALFVDGSTRFINNSIDPAELRTMGESGAPPVTVSSSKTYRDDEYKFSFDYPEGWQRIIRPVDVPNSLVFVAGQKVDGIAPSILVMAIPISDVSNEDLLGIRKAAFQSMLESEGLENMEILDFGNREIGGKKCLFCHYQATIGENTIERLHFTFILEGKHFIILAMDSQASFGKKRSDFDSIINSFQFD